MATRFSTLIRISFAAAVGALMLAGCAVGPDYQTPLPDAPAQGAFAGAAGFDSASPPDEWWTLYQDPGLTAAIEAALAANTDIRIAIANLGRAGAIEAGVRGERLPDVVTEAAVTRSREPVLSVDPPVEFEDTTYSLGIAASYQVDVFGRIGRTLEAARANTEAAQAALDVARLTVAAATASTYVDACAASNRIEVARENLALQQQSLDLTERLHEAGRGTGLDVARAGAQLEQTRALIPAMEADRAAALYRLAVLRGEPPASGLTGAAAECLRPIRLDRRLPAGDGAMLLSRRPDIRRAERLLAAATARVGMATADLYPSVSIGASVGTTALDSNELGDRASTRFSVGPLLRWNIPNRTAARSQLAAAEANADGALAAFDGTWLIALQETETALFDYARELERNDALSEARRYSVDAAQLATQRFDAGQASFLDVLQAEQARATVELGLADSEAELADLQIALFLVLGGGFGEQ